MKKLTLVILTASAMLCGCAKRPGGTPPLVYQLLTTALVTESLKNSPHTADKVRQFQPLACALATRRIVQPEIIARAIAGVTKDDRDAQAIGDAVLALYVGAIGTTTPTNEAAAWPYMDAVFCAGISNALVRLETPLTRGRNAVPMTPRWPLVR